MCRIMIILVLHPLKHNVFNNTSIFYEIENRSNFSAFKVLKI